MPKAPELKPLPPFPAVGGEYEWNGAEFVRRSSVTAPGCEADLNASVEIDGATVQPLSPDGPL